VRYQELARRLRRLRRHLSNLLISRGDALPARPCRRSRILARCWIPLLERAPFDPAPAPRRGRDRAPHACRRRLPAQVASLVPDCIRQYRR
jgi:hypothetical protein